MPITADFNPLYVTAGGKAVNVSDRTAPILTRHARFSFIFQFVAASDVWTPITTTRTVFVNGIDDTTASPYTQAGYSTVTQPNNSILLTDAYKGGAWSEDFDCILLACGAVLQGEPRIIPAVALPPPDGAATTVALNSGFAGIESAQTDDFVQFVVNGAQLQILPTGSNTACAAYLGLLRLQQAGYSSANSPNFTGLGRNDGDSRYGFNTTVIVEGNRGNVAGFTPNRIEIDFLGSAAANTASGVGVTSGVQRLPALAARADGTLLALDFDMVVHYARIQVGEEKNDAGQMVPAYQGAYEVDRRKIRRFLGQDSICAI